MRFYRTKLMILFMIVAAGATFYYFGDTTKLTEKSLEIIAQTPLQSLVDKGEEIDKEKIDVDIQNAIQEAQMSLLTLNERSKEVQDHTTNVLGSSIEATKDATPIHEKVFEYSKYLYCQTVVEDYEEYHEISKDTKE